MDSGGQRLGGRAENHLCARSTWLVLLLESKVAEPTLQTQQKLMRTEIQTLRDMLPARMLLNHVHRRAVALWENGGF